MAMSSKTLMQESAWLEFKAELEEIWDGILALVDRNHRPSANTEERKELY